MRILYNTVAISFAKLSLCLKIILIQKLRRSFCTQRELFGYLLVFNKNSSGDEIANVNFYTQCARKLLEFAEITQNNAITPFKVIQGHRFWYQSKAHIQFPISD